MTQQPTLLPLLSTGPHGSRSHMTCQFRCGNACSKPIPNETDNPEFHEVAAQALARRSVLKAAGAGVGALAIGGTHRNACCSSCSGSLRQALRRQRVWAPPTSARSRPTSRTG